MNKNFILVLFILALWLLVIQRGKYISLNNGGGSGGVAGNTGGAGGAHTMQTTNNVQQTSTPTLKGRTYTA